MAPCFTSNVVDKLTTIHFNGRHLFDTEESFQYQNIDQWHVAAAKVWVFRERLQSNYLLIRERLRRSEVLFLNVPQMQRPAYYDNHFNLTALYTRR